MIAICDFAVGLSRQLYGLSIQSERPEHRLTGQWHPLGPIGVISAFFTREETLIRETGFGTLIYKSGDLVFWSDRGIAFYNSLNEIKDLGGLSKLPNGFV